MLIHFDIVFIYFIQQYILNIYYVCVTRNMFIEINFFDIFDF
jgi:hypothetical protein